MAIPLPSSPNPSTWGQDAARPLLHLLRGSLLGAQAELSRAPSQWPVPHRTSPAHTQMAPFSIRANGLPPPSPHPNLLCPRRVLLRETGLDGPQTRSRDPRAVEALSFPLVLDLGSVLCSPSPGLLKALDFSSREPRPERKLAGRGTKPEGARAKTGPAKRCTTAPANLTASTDPAPASLPGGLPAPPWGP